ncbi:MAG: CehA/McbA family metallohydrolase [Verrucomicrobiales bacterium]
MKNLSPRVLIAAFFLTVILGNSGSAFCQEPVELKPTEGKQEQSEPPKSPQIDRTLISESAMSPKAIEIGDAEFEELPGGKEADGIVGDFVLRNDRVEVVVSGDLPLRRPNMSAFYGDDNHTPGCLYDLTLRDANNDQITIFTPSGQRGPVSYVRLDESVGEDAAGVETVTTAAKGDGLATRHQYILEKGWQGVLIVSGFRNESNEEKEVKLTDTWTQMTQKGSVKGIQWADAVDPADKCGYAYAWVEERGASLPKSNTLTLRPGEEQRVARFLAVGESPAEAVGIVAGLRDPDSVGAVSVQLVDEEGEPIPSGRVGVPLGDEKVLYAYPDRKGVAEFLWPVGSHGLVIEDMGRETEKRTASVEAGGETRFEVPMGKQARVAFSITDTDGGDTPCKVQFNARKGTAKLDLGPTNRAHGCVDQWQSETGSFKVPLPPGDYRIVVTRGPEYDSIVNDVTLEPGQELKIGGELVRSVSTPGWVSADFHNHSTPSGDNTCGVDDRVINIAAEHVEFAPTTEHNRLYDWAPHIEALGLEKFVSTIPGMELTGRGAHFNTFPLEPEPKRQDGGAPVWQKDPRLNAIVLRDYQGAERDRWVHLNHPDMSENFVDRDHDGRADGGYAYLGNMLDGLETQNFRESHILAEAPFDVVPARTGLGKRVEYRREFIWLQLLNQGLKVWGIGVNDAHHVYGNGVGGWRTYLPSRSDEPAEIDWREMSRNAKAGRMIVTNGPYLEVETGSGSIAGGYDRVSGELDLHVRVQCADWLDIDRVQVLVNGKQDPRYNYTRAGNADMFGDGTVKFDHRLSLDLSEDAHLIVVAYGENGNLQGGFGTSSQSAMQPCAYNNPIYVDVDGGGFEPNYDTLGYDLPVRNLTVDAVDALLGD